MLPGTCLTPCCVTGIASRLPRLTVEKDSQLQARNAGLPCPMGLSRLSPGTFLMVRICSATLICHCFLGICSCRGRKRDTFVSCKKFTSYLHFRLSCGLYQACSTCCRRALPKNFKEKRDDPNSYFIQSVDNTKMKKVGFGVF